MRAFAACLSIVVLGLLTAGAAGAQGPLVETLDANPVSTPQLGVDAQGGAVVAWVGFAGMAAADGATSYVEAVQISERAPGAGAPFGPAQTISGLGSDVTRDIGLAVGRRGDAAVVWRAVAEHRGATPIMVSRRAAGATFTRPRSLGGSSGGRNATVAVGGEGSVLVAWLRGSGRRGCGSVVWAARAKAGRSFGRATRVSSACARASAPRAALGPDGRGAVAWRARPSGGETELQAAAFRRGHFTRAREISRAPISAVDFDLTGDRTGATVAWRDAGGNTGSTGDAGRVLVARIAAGLRPRPRTVADGGRLAGPPRIVANASGAALVVFEQVPDSRPLHRPAVLASRRRSLGGSFLEPEVVAACGAADATKTFAFPALDASGLAMVVFQTTCGGLLGIGPNPGLAVAAASPRGAWSPPVPLSSGGYAVGAQVGMADAGAAVAAWTERAFGAPEAIEGLRVAALR
jgi:hypothetical protein